MSAFLLVSSDIHNDEEAFEILSQIAEDKECLGFLYCGDLNIENYFIATKLLNRNFPFIQVMGNCDSPWMYRDLNMSESPLFRSLCYNNKKIFITHGHYGIEPFDFGLKNIDFDICLSGHSHIPFIEKRENRVYLNPGSPALPRGKSCKSYATIEFMDDGKLLFSLRELKSQKPFSECLV